MKHFFDCLVYLIILGVSVFVLGRILPKKWFRYDRFPYAPFNFEKEGAIYLKLGVRKWKDKLPDMSRICPSLITSKKLFSKDGISPERLALMLQENCIAEFAHTLLCIAGFGCIRIWPGLGGWIISLVYLLGNIPFNIIQRYNRPKLAKLYCRLSAKK